MTLTFQYHGTSIRNHNHLLGRVEGVDGIKTGYTRASGFNLASSVHRGDCRIVAVVLGGTSDARMRSLIEEHMAETSSHRASPIALPIDGRKRDDSARLAIAALRRK